MLTSALTLRPLFRYFALILLSFSCAAWAKAESANVPRLDAEPEWTFNGNLAEQTRHNAGVLAARESTSFFADPATEATFTADLEAIYAVFPGLAAARARSGSSTSIAVQPEAEVTIESILEEFPGDWDVAASESYSGGWFTVQFNRFINGALMSEWVGSFPGVADAESNFFFGDGSDLYYHDEGALYAFKLGWGDCPAGCISSKWRFIAIAPAGPTEIEIDAALDRVGAMPRLPVHPRIRAHAEDTLQLPENVADAYGLSIRQLSDLGSPWGQYTIDILARPRPMDGLPRQNLSFELVDRGGSPALSGKRLPSGWLWHEQFGWLWDQAYPWVWHPDHGWLYAGTEDDTQALWFYSAALGWSYWDTRSYPWIYTASSWLFDDG